MPPVPPPPPPSGPRFFVLRTPLLPLAWIREWSAGQRAVHALHDPLELDEAVAHDLAHARSRMAAALAFPEVREALFVASPALHREVDGWLDGTLDGRGAARVEGSLARYLLRMAGRATPFGLFAGGTLGEIADETRLAVPPRTRYRRHARIDAAQVWVLADRFLRDEAVLRQLEYFPNPTLYRVGGELRFYESVEVDGARTPVLSTAEWTPFLQAVLDRAAGGASLDGCAAVLLGMDEDLSADEVMDFVWELARNQLLVAGLAPSSTGDEPAAQLLARLPPAVRQASREACALAEALEQVAGLNRLPLGLEPQAYARVERTLAAAGAQVGDETRPWHLELVKEGSPPSLDGAIVGEIERAAEVLHRLSAQSAGDELSAFREAFHARYEGEEIPLLQALDDEVGVGLPPYGVQNWMQEPLLRGAPAPAGEEREAWSRAHLRLLTRLYHQGLRDGEARLTEKDMAALPAVDAQPLPRSYSVLASLVRGAGGRTRILFRHARGPSAARFFGRFCYSDPAMAEQVAGLLRRERAADPEAIHAEVSYLPAGRTGNIHSHPVFTEWEITLSGSAGVPVERRIPVSDLMVSVRAGRIELRSRSLGSRVVPRVTSMLILRHQTALPVHRFLEMMEGEGGRAPDPFSWGALTDAPHLPRVVWGDTVLSRARWRLALPAGEVHASAAARFRAVQQLRSRHGLPRFVHLAEADNELPLDLDNPLCALVLHAELASRGEATVLETLVDEGEPLAQGPDGGYVNEILVPVQHPAPVREPPWVGSVHAPALVRRYPPGSEWLFLKVYTGTATADALLRGVIDPLARQAVRAGDAAEWFFIRYRDRESHLRVRIRAHPGTDPVCGILPGLHDALAPCLESGAISALELGTYVREVERYGGAEAIASVEAIFHADSEAVVAALVALEAQGRLQARWQAGLVSMHALLDDFDIPLEQRLRLAKEWRRAAYPRPGAAAREHLARVHREHRDQVVELLSASDAGSSSAVADAFALRSVRMKPLAEALRALEQAQRLTVPVASILGSLVHMTANRVFAAAPNQQEGILYDLLVRYYTGLLARSGVKVPPAGL